MGQRGDGLNHIFDESVTIRKDCTASRFIGDGSNLTGISTGDEKAKVSSNDTTAGYLNGKLVAGSNITLTENNNGGNETLTIASTSSGSSLTIKEVDGTPSVSDVDTIVVSNGTLTDNGSGQVTITTGGGGSSISFGSDNQIPYTNSSTDDFDYSSSLTFDGSVLTVIRDRGSETTGTQGAANLRALTSGQMVDGFGVGFALSVQDTNSGVQNIASVVGYRDGADTDGAIGFNTWNSDVPVTSFIMRSDGRVFMPQVYADTISGSTRDLYIKDDGQVGYISSTLEDKENIQNKTEYSKIYNLIPKIYDRKDGSVTGEVGLIAEEVNLIMPEIVSYKRQIEWTEATEEDGKKIKSVTNTNIPETINYSKLIMPLLIEVQHLKKEIEKLKNK
jgi:hypothetical protein